MDNILGLDLSAKEKNKTGYFYIKDNVNYGILHKDKDIINLIKEVGFKFVFIDAPVSYEYPYRIEERLLYKEGFKPLPLSIKSMKALYERTNYIMGQLKDIKFIETFPRAVEKILKLKYEYFDHIFRYKDIYDAYLAFLSGLFYINNKYKKYGELVLPKLDP
ncbi:hypothetical protein MJ1_0071 [Nanobdella aerobiophila]|uniref:DUF429 domain-containing protein n=1 Tax=Nanobdella aerobiophila TaxID=2586965 RepID=A0A915SJU1_9ARCH|nr:hypothetical protein [Nanobdella aerobiophila]BBL45248.1 hypothetical protein MJ1_0071 [Nanobdella aerobiophila]